MTHEQHRAGASLALLPVIAAVRLLHPFPTVLNAAAAVALAAVAVRGWPGMGVALRLAGTMLAAQSAIGIVNDIIDRELDAAAKPWKPVPRGAVSLPVARALAVLAMTLATALGATFGPAALAFSTAGMGVGLAYDLWLKRTSLSSMTYAVALPLVPLWVWTATGRFNPALLWVWPVGVLLGGALQLANALPDLESDAAGGVRGTAQWLGRRGAIAACWGGFLAAILLALGLGLALGHDRRLLLPGLTAATVLLAIAVALYLRRPGPAALHTGWTLLAPATGLVAVIWLAALPA